MGIEILTGPIIGSLIGYGTNYIAVKMMFRPYYPVTIGSYTLPFTPGIIPKGRKRLARAVGETVGNTLLTREDIEKTILSPEMKEELRQGVREFFRVHKEDEAALKEILGKFMTEEKYRDKKEDIAAGISALICRKAEEMEIGQLVVDKALEKIREIKQGSFLLMMVSDDMILSMVQPVGAGLEEYVRNHGQEMVEPKVREELEKLEEKTTGSLVEMLAEYETEIENALVSVYERLAAEKLEGFLKHINVSAMIEEKINEMDVKELEELVLSVMKKELNAVVNLGAVIGFVIGFLNVLF